jgi:hypothetical protein
VVVTESVLLIVNRIVGIGYDHATVGRLRAVLAKFSAMPCGETERRSPAREAIHSAT